MKADLIELRKRLGLNQEEAAMLLGVSRGHISKLEIGQDSVSGLSEVYLFQAVRWLDEMEEIPLPEIPAPGPPGNAPDILAQLQIKEKKLSIELKSVREQIQTGLCLKNFLIRLKQDPDFEKRKLAALILRLERRISIETETFLPEKLAELASELSFIQTQIQYLMQFEMKK